MRRRRFLATTAAATLSTGVLTATAGCQSDDSAVSTSTQSADSAVLKPTQLDKLWFVNHADDGCDVSVTVTGFEIGGEGREEVVHEASFRLEPDANVTRDPEVSPFGKYVVDVTVGDETLTADTSEHVNERFDCVRLKYERWTDRSVELVPTTYDNC